MLAGSDAFRMPRVDGVMPSRRVWCAVMQLGCFLKLMGLRTRQLLSKRYAGFEWMLKMLVDGVKGQTCSHSRLANAAELAACKTLEKSKALIFDLTRDGIALLLVASCWR